MKTNFSHILSRFARGVVDIQAYLNILYLVIAFPLGVFYFVFLVSGLSLGLSTIIVWVGIPLLVLVSLGWYALARVERYMAVCWLKEDLPEMAFPSPGSTSMGMRIKKFYANEVTWKSLIYLFLKFPLGIATFVVTTALISLTLAFLTAPFTYKLAPGFQLGVFWGSGLPEWRVDTLPEAFLVMFIGLFLWPLTLQVTHGMAWLHAKFARIMLSAGAVERLDSA